MTAIDDAIEAAQDYRRLHTQGSLNSGPTIAGFVRAAVRSKHLIARDDRAGLIEALGLKQVGWRHVVGSMKVDRPMGTDGISKAIHLANNSSNEWIDCADCPDCKPVYTLEEQP